MACAVIALALVQFASDALYARAAPQALVSHIPLAFGVRVYQAIDAIAPAAYVNDALADAMLQQGDPATALSYAVRMPPGSRRDALLARIAQAQGDDVLAGEYAFAADDVDAVQRDVARVARYNLPQALQLEARFRERLIAAGTHPDAVAESYAISANYEAWLHRYPTALALDAQALALAPLNMGYVLSAANNAYLSGDLADAQRLFEDGVSIDPAGGDAYAGLGLIALREGRRDRAQAYLQRARVVDPHAQMIPALEAALR
ncbi:MAG TPA: tetratricopeptide repeat protein [Candidatus Acidoferrum sp.]|nr:tetratricopeptide repeat protein [Candidatus Acidoferrum sp.]